jgi:hypothetical protein
MGRKEIFVSIDSPNKDNYRVQHWSKKHWKFESGAHHCHQKIEHWKKHGEDIS